MLQVTMEYRYVTIVFACMVAYFVYLIVKKVSRLYRYNLPPGGKVPLANGRHLQIWDHKERFGHVSRMKIFGRDVYILNTIESIRHFMLAPELINFTSSRERVSFVARRVMNDGIVTCRDSNKFRKVRALVFTTLKPYASKAIEQIVTSELLVMKEQLKKVEGQEIDIQDYIGPSLANIMFIMMIGKRFEYDHKIQHSMVCMLKEISNIFTVNSYLTMFPFLQYLPFGYGKIVKDCKNAMDVVMKYVLYDIRAEGREAWEKRDGFVYDLLKQQQQHDWLTDADIHGIIRDMFLAGIATTKATLYSLFLFMLHTPDVQPKIHKELDDLNDEPSINYQDRLPYTQAVILESLRLASTVPMSIGHVVTQDVQLYGYDIPKDSMVLTNQWKVHHDDTLWCDPWTFVPERFIDAQDGTLLLIDDPVRRNLIAFGLGRRKCIGDNFARTRMFLFLSHLCHTFRFYSDDPHKLPSMDPKTFNPGPLNKPRNYKVKVAVRN